MTVSGALRLFSGAPGHAGPLNDDRGGLTMKARTVSALGAVVALAIDHDD
jgi:hypothetical protein